MRKLICRCPETQQPADLELYTDYASLARIWSNSLRFQCPHCGANARKLRAKRQRLGNLGWLAGRTRAAAGPRPLHIELRTRQLASASHNNGGLNDWKDEPPDLVKDSTGRRTQPG